jgi:glycosyltransferase involved in cell wall biosynthesis
MNENDKKIKLLHIAAGAGNMYCGACARDMAMVRGLLANGIDAQIIPLYTPLRYEYDEGLEILPVKMGGINLYLQQISPIFGKLPQWMKNALDKPKLLEWAAGFSVKTDAASLGDMTLSMLAGKDGKQRDALQELIAYINELKPDIVSITNSMLSGIAPVIKETFNLPIICSLQGEDDFIMKMGDKYVEPARKLLSKNADYIDVYISPTYEYADKMAEFLRINRKKIAVVHPSVDTGLYQPETLPNEKFTIGYLSVITHGKGLDILLDAMQYINKDIKLIIAGKITDDNYYKKEIYPRLIKLGNRDIEWHGEATPAEKLNILNRLSLFIVPGRMSESRAIAALEAMSCGISLIAPNLGIFTTLSAESESVMLYEPGNADELAAKINEIYADPGKLPTLSTLAASLIRDEYSIKVNGERMWEIVKGLVSFNID